MTQSGWHDAWVGTTFWLAAAMVGSALLLAWYSVAHLPKAVDVTPASQPPEAIVTSEIIAGAAELEPPFNENETRA